MAIREAVLHPASENSDLSTGLILALVAASAIVAWTTPNHYPPWMSFHAELAMAVSALLAGAWVLWHAREERPVLPALTLMTPGSRAAALGATGWWTDCLRRRCLAGIAVSGRLRPLPVDRLP